ncbi:MAG: hypothetical protein AAF566_08650 [Pseudomonadota bacterium]
MQVIFHIGAHCTGHDRLVRSLLKNRDMLADYGVVVPGPGRYRKVLSEALKRLRGAPASQESEDLLIETVVETDAADRVILSNESFICMAPKVLDDGKIYGRIEKSAWLRNAFPSARTEFALSLRNFATFLPALYEKIGGDFTEANAFLRGIDPVELSWVDVVAGLRAANPDCPILVWCDEDTPLLWSEIMREIAGLDGTAKIEGANDMARRLMSQEGNRRMRRYLDRKPPRTENTRRRVLAAFLSKYAEDAEIEQEILLPGWTEDLIEDLTRNYDEDLEEIAAMPGVKVLTP